MSTDKSGFWSGLGIAACIFAFLLGIGSCSYLDKKGNAAVLEAGGIQQMWTLNNDK